MWEADRKREERQKIMRSYQRSLIRGDILDIVIGIFTVPFGIVSIYQGIKGLCEHKHKEYYE